MPNRTHNICQIKKNFQLFKGTNRRQQKITEFEYVYVIPQEAQAVKVSMHYHKILQ